MKAAPAESDALAFYRALPPVRCFEDATDLSFFRPAPDDWIVVLSDIRGSTRAIQEGRYKDVNLIGAATIAAIQNACGERGFPFVFGGDGSTALLPEALAERARPELERLQKHARENFGFELRVGLVPLAEVHRLGARVYVGRYERARGSASALFLGGGLSAAERLLKKDPAGARFLIDSSRAQGAPSLETLSCRWAPIPSRRGQMISILVQPLDAERASEVYGSLWAELQHLIEDEKSRPVDPASMRMERFLPGLRREVRLRKDLGLGGAFRKIVAQMIVARVVHWLPWLPMTAAWRSYLADVAATSDYRKLDDALRMVLDCSAEQADALEAALERRYRAGELAYGVHRSSAALMTCLVGGLAPGQHVHFIDGNDGGYAMASRDLKERASKRPL